VIEVRELRKSFGQVQALRGISFHCEPGKVTGLLGPNGAGKTTTIRILSTILKPLSGTATVNGFDVVRESDKVRASLGVVLENTGQDRVLISLTPYSVISLLTFLSDLLSSIELPLKQSRGALT